MEPFFLPAAGGDRFCLYHPARGDGPVHGAVIFVPPFAEEMNKSRRMVALQARRFCAEGFAVLQMDLFGCGDSGGEFIDARWDIWLDDLASAVRWLADRVPAPLFLWGLRLGGALALEFVPLASPSPAGVLLWQPVVSGEAFLTQFLRLKVAAERLSGDDAGASTSELRRKLAAGEVCEIAGYELHPDLASRIDAVQLGTLAPTASKVGWIEVVAQPGRSLGPASNRVLGRWRQVGCTPVTSVVVGEPFWTTVEISQCAPLLSASSDMLMELM